MAQYANLKLQPVQPLDLTMKQSSAPPAVAAIAAHEAAPVEPSAQAIEETAPAPTQVESALPVAEQITTATQVSSRSGLTGLLHIIELQTLLTDIHIPHNVLRAGQPFEVCLTLDLTDIVASPDSELAYIASFYGQSLGESTRHTLGIAHGTIRPGDRITVRIGGRSLPRGIYRLEALVSVKLATGRDSPRQELITYKRGDPLEVY